MILVKEPLHLGGIFDFDNKVERLEEVSAELEQPDVWNDPEKAQALGKERSSLEAVVNTIKSLQQGLDDVDGLLELAIEADDQATFDEAVAELISWSRAWLSLSLEECSVAPMMPLIVMWICKPVQAVLRRKTGLKCCCGCIYVGQKAKALKLN